MAVLDAVIIGAGAAGIAAGRHLIAARQRILILEARDRTGGRAMVDHRLGVPADLGAAWLHFADENAWTGIAERGGFTVLRRKPGWGAEAWIGARAPTAAERSAAADDYQRYNALVEAAATSGLDVPVAAVLPEDAYRPRFDAVMTWAVGVESHAVSTLDLHRYAESNADWAVKEGLGAVVASAAEGLPVQLGTRVTAIDWTGPTLRIDSTAGRLEARAAIVTVPTSLLARGAIRFEPPLPPTHQQAIATLPLGVCNKVFFRLSNTGFAAALPSNLIGSTSTSRTCSWQARVADQPLLMAYFGGDLSWELEQAGGLEPFARAEFRRLFGGAAVAELGPAVATAWGSDPFSMGSYSAALPGYAASREQLAVPVSPQLCFAGEACSNHYFGTLHGAWQSGVTAAARLATPGT